MKIYSLLKLNSLIKNHRIKFFGLYLLHRFNKRYLAVHFDPVNACNLRCKMCYFTDENYIKKLKGIFDVNELSLLGKAVLGRTLKLQIGCGTEPTLYKDITEIIKIAKNHGVPHISLTTNANLLKSDKLEEWVTAGLQEITVSLHGVYRESYEYFMQNADYNKFINSLQMIAGVKKKYPEFRLRVNYTFNEDNFNELKDFFSVFGKYPIDTLQIRPISRLGNTAYQNFKMDRILPEYENVISVIKKECLRRGINLIAAQGKENLINRKTQKSLLYKYTYCYISPTAFWHKDFDWKNETYDMYAVRKKIPQEILKNSLKSLDELQYLQTENLNYTLS